MKIITWNCNGALRKKYTELNTLDADILVIQECENPEESTKEYKDWADNYLWLGESKNRGIGIFAKKGNSIEKIEQNGSFEMSCFNSTSPSLKWETKALRLFLPFSINNSIQALGVWTKGSDAEVFGYMGQFWKYLQIHKKDLSNANQIILGDFNSNKLWDKADRWWSHTDVVNELEDIGIESLYHHKFSENQGNESMPTFFLHRKEEKPYHIDYVFVSKKYLASNIIIGEKSKWLELSDHLPLITELKSKQ